MGEARKYDKQANYIHSFKSLYKKKNPENFEMQKK